MQESEVTKDVFMRDVRSMASSWLFVFPTVIMLTSLFCQMFCCDALCHHSQSSRAK